MVALALALSACDSLPFASNGPAVSVKPTGVVEQPPPMSMVVVGAGDPPVEGEAGSWSLPNGGSDGPWLPGAALRGAVDASAGDALEVTIEDAAIESWSAAYGPSPAAEPAPTALGERPGPLEERSITFPAPPPGDWVVEVDVVLVGGGTITSYWRVLVGPT
jgi:hypothetical protein